MIVVNFHVSFVIFQNSDINRFSGGPLVVKDDDLGENIQIGVVSFVAKKGCEAQLPTGFVRVTYYLDWIHEKSGVEIRS